MSWIALGLLGGVVGLDATSFPQMMLSRPIVAGALVGLVLGHPAAGLLVGGVLEAFALVILPFGAARYPESGTAAAAAAAAYIVASEATLDYRALLLTVVFALAWEQIAGASVVFTRRINERLVRGPAGDGRLPAALVERRHLLAMGIDFVRGSWAVLLGTMLGSLLLRLFDPIFGISGPISVRLVTVAAAVMIASLIPLFGGLRERWLSLAAGVLCGLLLLMLLK
ncbi:MAG TPA: PTS sugar transporter subunit IIC [Longimicrobiales bacterium]|nr:PTS sugar transporter subunit IIC [Longimicrobiales bacterium]